MGLGRLGGQLLSLVYLTLGRVALCVRVYLCMYTAGVCIGS